MQMQHGLGQFLGDRYQGYLNASYMYKREEIYIRSTDVDRCLMSAESDLAGLYPPTEAEKFDPDIAWQPIPVHTIPIEEDYVSFERLLVCFANSKPYFGTDGFELIFINLFKSASFSFGHSRHQKTTSNFLRITLKGSMRV